MTISQTRTAMAHSMSYPIALDLGLDHGIACSLMLPELLRFNAGADDGRLGLLARELGLVDVEGLTNHLSQLQRTLAVDSTYREACSDVNDLLDLRERMVSKGRAEKNMRPLGDEDLTTLLKTMDERLRSP